MTNTEITTAYQAIKAGAPNEIFDSLDIKDIYYLAKAHKLANLEHFLIFWNDGRDKQFLHGIINAFCPPQTCNNTLQEAISHTGFQDLPRFYNIARTIS